MKLIWSPLALDRALEAKAYIAADNPRAAEKWASRLVHAVAKLKRYPKVGRIVPEIGLDEYREPRLRELSRRLSCFWQHDIHSHGSALQPAYRSR